MSHTVVYRFRGDAEALYKRIIEAIQPYDVPNLEVEMQPLDGGPGLGQAVGGFLSRLKGEDPPEAPAGFRALVLHDTVNKALITACQHGGTFYLGLAFEWYSDSVAKWHREASEKGWRTPESQIAEICFNSVVRHVVGETFFRYVEESGHEGALPDPREVFAVSS